MTDPAQSPLPPGIPPGSIHLGSFNLAGKGPGTFMGGVVKLFSKPDEDLLDAATSFYNNAVNLVGGRRIAFRMSRSIE